MDWNTHESILTEFAQEVGEHFERERAKKFPALIESLQNKGRSLAGGDWGRCVRYQYSDSPLSAWGSIKSVPGGRFNFGEIAPKYPPFAALYVAEDFTTAFKEKSGNYVGGKAPCASLDIEDLTLSKKESHAWVRLNILLTNVLDVRESGSLEDFTILLQKIKMPSRLRQKAIMLKLKPPGVHATGRTRPSLFSPKITNRFSGGQQESTGGMMRPATKNGFEKTSSISC